MNGVLFACIYAVFFVLLCFNTSETKSLFDRSSIMDRKETLPPLPEMDSPPMSPRKQLRPIKAADSQNSQQGRSVDELKELIRKKLQNNYQAFEEVNFVSFCYVNAFRQPPLNLALCHCPVSWSSDLRQMLTHTASMILPAFNLRFYVDLPR